jgi:hypothetical protein
LFNQENAYQNVKAKRQQQNQERDPFFSENSKMAQMQAFFFGVPILEHLLAGIESSQAFRFFPSAP